jgi:hypothetical protein
MESCVSKRYAERFEPVLRQEPPWSDKVPPDRGDLRRKVHR